MNQKILSPNKKNVKKLTIICLFIGFTSFAQTNFYTGNLDQTAWNNLVSEVNTKKNTLESKITEAEALPSPLETSYASGTVVTVNEFLKYAIRDRQNAAALQIKYESGTFNFWNGLWEQYFTNQGFYTPTPDFSVHNPLQQLHDCIKILDTAITEIQNQLDNNIVLKETLDFTTSGYPTLPANSSYYIKDGNTIFPSTFWGLRDDNLDILETLGYLGEIFHSAGQTTTGTYKGDPTAIIATPNFVTQKVNQIISQVGNNQTPTQIQMTHTNLSNAITTKYPGIGNHPKAFVHYDIDHPEIKNLNESIISTIVPQIVTAANGSPLIYVLSNEPHWDISEGQASNGVSNNTYDAYVNHLKTEYGNDINALNNIYNPHNSNQNFVNFEALKSTYTIPLNRNTWQGTPIWYDWMRFNMDRSNRWHQDLKDIVVANDPNAKVSIKLLGRELEDPRRDGGIDLEALTDLQDILGFDNQVVPNETHGRNNRFSSYKTHYLANYIIDWREQSMMLDFSKSLHPNKPTFDSEWHGHSSNAWNNHALDEGYTKAALWMAFTNGLSVINNWWWYRDNNGDLLGKTAATGNTMFSPQHQAIAFDEFGRTLKELNAHGNTVATLTPNKRDYLIYYSAEAAIQDWTYTQHLSIIYEAFKLLNVKVGFTTESKINSLGYTPKALIIPPTLFIKDSSIDALNTFNTNNSSVDIVQINRFSGPANYAMNEKGTSDNSRSTSFANKSFSFTTSITGLISRLRGQLSFPSPIIDFQIKEEGTNTEAFGVFASQGNTPDNKKVISLINLSLENRDILFTSNTTNLITSENIGMTHTMKPYDVLLITDGSTLSIQNTQKVSKPYVLFPNPVSDVLTVKNTFQGKYALYNITGSLVKSINSNSDIVEINVTNLNSGMYFLEIPTSKGIRIEKIMID